MLARSRVSRIGWAVCLLWNRRDRVDALIGGLAGLPFGPLAVTIGVGGGAAIGISADLLNQGDEASVVREISRELAPGKSAVVAEVDEDGVIAFDALMQAVGGAVRDAARPARPLTTPE